MKILTGKIAPPVSPDTERVSPAPRFTVATANTPLLLVPGIFMMPSFVRVAAMATMSATGLAEAEILSEEVEERHRLIVGESAEMKQAVDLAKKAACRSATVLLLGESGTGKEIFAPAIHNWSERKDRPFIAINSVGLSKELLESELFGHEQGAFTGAHRRKTGKIEFAQGGTIFFDEIGDVSQELQAKLLRFLQEREFERVGGVTPIAVDVRIIAATNRNLERSVKEGRSVRISTIA